MRKLLIITCLTLFCLTIKAQNTDTVATEDNEIFTAVQEPPSFPGGMEKFKEYLSSSLKYTDAQVKKYSKGAVYVTFVVEKDGSLNNVKILRGIEDLDRQTIEAVKGSPKWNPGKHNGHLLRVQYTIGVYVKDYKKYLKPVN